MSISLAQLAFLAQECQRQQSGELSVYWMTEAFVSLESRSVGRISVYDLLVLAEKVEPYKNQNGFRKIPVHFKSGSFAINAASVPTAIKALLDSDIWKEPDEFYKEFQRIHPFIDGNGRVGAILWNYFRGTMDNPTCPPDFFGAHS